MVIHNISVTTVILAGGLGTRIGGNKGLQTLQGRELISWVLQAVSPVSDQIIINANDTQDAYAHFGCRVLADDMPDWPGPLAGLHAALRIADTDCVMTVPCDTPFLPHDLIARLTTALTLEMTEAAVAVAGGRRQPTIALYNRNVLSRLNAYLDSGGRRVNDWLDTLQTSEVVFDNADSFCNINTLEDLERASQVSINYS